MDFGTVTGIISCAVSLGSLVGILVKMGSYKGQTEERIKNIESQVNKHNDQIEKLFKIDSLEDKVKEHDREIERLQCEVDDAESTSKSVEVKLEGLASELKTSMDFIRSGLSEVKEMVRDAKAK